MNWIVNEILFELRSLMCIKNIYNLIIKILRYITILIFLARLWKIWKETLSVVELFSEWRSGAIS